MNRIVIAAMTLGVVLATSWADNTEQPKFPPIPPATWELTGNSHQGNLVIDSAQATPQNAAVLQVQGTLYGDRISGYYDRRNAKLWLLRGSTQFWEGDYDPETSSIKGRFHPLNTGGGLPAADGKGCVWETTKNPVTPGVVLLHCGTGKVVFTDAKHDGGYVHVAKVPRTALDERSLLKLIPSRNAPEYVLIYHQGSSKYVGTEHTKPGRIFRLFGSIPEGKEDQFLFKLEPAQTDSPVRTVYLRHKHSGLWVRACTSSLDLQKGDDREWKGGGREFKTADGKGWCEYSRDQLLHRFKVEAVTDDYVQLLDPSRSQGVRVRLYDDRCDVQVLPSQDFTTYYQGGWDSIANHSPLQLWGTIPRGFEEHYQFQLLFPSVVPSP